ncbi:MAG: endonuclease/exonuclease/phosphatase family protein [Planctomycetes bacterium]|nr:endonuclease/exonuclease/phosphatase family protein [Planctomycetota bacterium]
MRLRAQKLRRFVAHPFLGVLRDRRLRLAAILSVAVAFAAGGLPRAARAAVRSSAPPRNASQLRNGLLLQSLNVFGLPWPAGNDVANRCSRIAAAIDASAPDVVALQEVWDDESRTPLLVEGYDAAWCESASGLLGQNGLMTLSRLPIVESRLFRFSSASGVEVWTSKGALRTVLSAPGGGSIPVWNVHLQSGVDAGTIRADQIRELTAWIAECGDRCCVVLGDFNCAPGDAEWPALVDRLAALGIERRSGDEPTYDHFQNPLATPEPPAAIDHVFVGAALPGRETRAHRAYDRPSEHGFVSDHFGLEILLPRR